MGVLYTREEVELAQMQQQNYNVTATASTTTQEAIVTRVETSSTTVEGMRPRKPLAGDDMGSQLQKEILRPPYEYSRRYPPEEQGEEEASECGLEEGEIKEKGSVKDVRLSNGGRGGFYQSRDEYRRYEYATTEHAGRRRAEEVVYGRHPADRRRSVNEKDTNSIPSAPQYGFQDSEATSRRENTRSNEYPEVNISRSRWPYDGIQDTAEYQRKRQRSRSRSSRPSAYSNTDRHNTYHGQKSADRSSHSDQDHRTKRPRLSSTASFGHGSRNTDTHILGPSTSRGTKNRVAESGTRSTYWTSGAQQYGQRRIDEPYEDFQWTNEERQGNSGNGLRSIRAGDQTPEQAIGCRGSPSGRPPSAPKNMGMEQGRRRSARNHRGNNMTPIEAGCCVLIQNREFIPKDSILWRHRDFSEDKDENEFAWKHPALVIGTSKIPGYGDCFECLKITSFQEVRYQEYYDWRETNAANKWRWEWKPQRRLLYVPFESDETSREEHAELGMPILRFRPGIPHESYVNVERIFIVEKRHCRPWTPVYGHKWKMTENSLQELMDHRRKRIIDGKQGAYDPVFGEPAWLSYGQLNGSYRRTTRRR
ncbi:hypothetical protein EJ08DRAFT_679763 [Tothia fuscella]|uniref:Uncharacterized protein n=1 Tax=Tothia fuscella TaxID=1048955 RepID=A0A9P4NPC5_9PEZI|nr:hypothetical protein EJ08DRAFT_679763 [Tothia fuscella]